MIIGEVRARIGVEVDLKLPLLKVIEGLQVDLKLLLLKVIEGLQVDLKLLLLKVIEFLQVDLKLLLLKVIEGLQVDLKLLLLKVIEGLQVEIGVPVDLAIFGTTECIVLGGQVEMGALDMREELVDIMKVGNLETGGLEEETGPRGTTLLLLEKENQKEVEQEGGTVRVEVRASAGRETQENNQEAQVPQKTRKLSHKAEVAVLVQRFQMKVKLILVNLQLLVGKVRRFVVNPRLHR